ncbi:MAG TPA: dynamin family protein [Acidimicrobiales bacterium]|nr:dynamin family protein [Acidimicrobiales bacterium]
MERIDLDGMLATTTALRAQLGEVRLPLATDDVETARQTADHVRRQLDDYVIPRLRDIDAPVLAVVGGSTGAGKSTLVNSVVGAEVTVPGVLRPTTRSPVLIHHPSAARWFEDDRVLGSLARVRGTPGQPVEGAHQLQLVASAAVPEDLALLDAPDIDSVLDRNREIAQHLLDAADLWVFVTTAARYADAVPWDFLRTASRRGVGIGLVLNRVPPGAGDEIAPHLASMLADEGLGDAPLFVLEEQVLSEGRLPTAAVAPMRAWLDDLAADREARADLVRQSLTGAVADVSTRTEEVASVVEQQQAAADQLAGVATGAFADAHQRLADDVRDGTVMRGEVLARWQDLVGTGELLRELQSRIGRLRDRIAASVTGRPRNVEKFQGAVESGVETLLRERVAEATDEVVLRWRATSAGAALLDAGGDELRRPSDDLGERASRLVRDWQGGLLDLLREEGAGKRTTAKILSYGLNGAALVLMVGVFAQTGGLTGAEVAIAGGSTAVGSTLLEALLGDQAVRRLTERARADLDRRTGELLADEAERFTSLVDGHRPDTTTARTLRELAAELRRALGTDAGRRRR